uniref:Uncharacterized protein n=1 Tax=Plectus sambesii TaxID=2011161 RepID=A0A914VC28_9BILA
SHYLFKFVFSVLLNDIPPEWENERQSRIREALTRGRHIQPYGGGKNVLLPGVEMMSPTSGSFFYTMNAVAKALNDLF